MTLEEKYEALRDELHGMRVRMNSCGVWLKNATAPTEIDRQKRERAGEEIAKAAAALAKALRLLD